jgi:mono/diheme cytochrome c family protein
VRLVLKPFLLAIVIAFSFLAFTTHFAQTSPADAGLLANHAYIKNCAKCHGKTAEGRHFGGPSLLSEKTAATSTEDLRNIIVNGKGHMPKFAGKLTPEEIDTLVRQIQALNKK